MAQQTFGGEWTHEKLTMLRRYLSAYTRIFESNPKARFYTTVYVDAFAGTGGYLIPNNDQRPGTLGMFADNIEPETEAFFKGSATIALEVEPRFKRYLFIERNQSRCKELENLSRQYPDRAQDIDIRNDDANHYLRIWCRQTNWSVTRAVLFLDPFGMEVQWSLLEDIAQFSGIDIWLLIPIGGINRHLTRREVPPDEWGSRLTNVLGTDEWKHVFYKYSPQPDLFDEGPTLEKDADYDAITSFIVDRLSTIYPGVVRHPLVLRNSRNSPLFLLCFMTTNKAERIRAIALKIASDILKKGT
jgi:three-Cys-motif partner protein